MMVYRWICLVVLMLLINFPSGWGAPPALAGTTGYVSDMLILTMRSGPGREYDVVRTLRSNMPVEILGEQGNFSRVSTQEGDEGWVESQYITFETPAPMIIDQLEKKIEELEADARNRAMQPDIQTQAAVAKAAELEAANISLQKELEKALKEKDAIAVERNRIQKEYADLVKTSANVLEVSEENKRLRQMNETLSIDVQFAREKNNELFKVGMLKWFGLGAGIFLFGWVLGRIFTGGSKRRSGGLLD